MVEDCDHMFICFLGKSLMRRLIILSFMSNKCYHRSHCFSCKARPSLPLIGCLVCLLRWLGIWVNFLSQAQKHPRLAETKLCLQFFKCGGAVRPVDMWSVSSASPKDAAVTGEEVGLFTGETTAHNPLYQHWPHWFDLWSLLPVHSKCSWVRHWTPVF